MKIEQHCLFYWNNKIKETRTFEGFLNQKICNEKYHPQETLMKNHKKPINLSHIQQTRKERKTVLEKVKKMSTNKFHHT